MENAEEAEEPKTRMVDLNGTSVEMRFVDENKLIALMAELERAERTGDVKSMLIALQDMYTRLLIPLIVREEDIRVVSGLIYGGMTISDLCGKVFMTGDGQSASREQRRASSRPSRRGRGRGGRR